MVLGSSLLCCLKKVLFQKAISNSWSTYSLIPTLTHVYEPTCNTTRLLFEFTNFLSKGRLVLRTMSLGFKNVPKKFIIRCYIYLSWVHGMHASLLLGLSERLGAAMDREKSRSR